VYFFGTIAVAAGLGVYGLGFQVRVGFGIGFTTGFEIGFGVALLPFCLAVMINLPVFGSV
jgi:hypothetical protein